MGAAIEKSATPSVKVALLGRPPGIPGVNMPATPAEKVPSLDSKLVKPPPVEETLELDDELLDELLDDELELLELDDEELEDDLLDEEL